MAPKPTKKDLISLSENRCVVLIHNLHRVILKSSAKTLLQYSLENEIKSNTLFIKPNLSELH